MGWRECTDDPNSEAALALRRRQLDSATCRVVHDRISWLEDLCRGRRVLDIGCADHASIDPHSPDWLHGRLVNVARECIGIDVDQEAIDRLREAGLDVHWCDVEGSPSGLDLGLFDIVVAGEVIEHLSCPQSLFETAHHFLGPNGLLAVTTPNPFAPWRTRAGQLGAVWENVDHLFYMFPSGMAELADRTGFSLVECSTAWLPNTMRPLHSIGVGLLSGLHAASATGSDERTGRLHRALPMRYISPLDWIVARYRRALARSGENSLYLLTRNA